MLTRAGILCLALLTTACDCRVTSKRTATTQPVGNIIEVKVVRRADATTVSIDQKGRQDIGSKFMTLGEIQGVEVTLGLTLLTDAGERMIEFGITRRVHTDDSEELDLILITTVPVRFPTRGWDVRQTTLDGQEYAPGAEIPPGHHAIKFVGVPLADETPASRAQLHQTGTEV